jgi:hypothetical protein
MMFGHLLSPGFLVNREASYSNNTGLGALNSKLNREPVVRSKSLLRGTRSKFIRTHERREAGRLKATLDFGFENTCVQCDLKQVQIARAPRHHVKSKPKETR